MYIPLGDRNWKLIKEKVEKSAETSPFDSYELLLPFVSHLIDEQKKWLIKNPSDPFPHHELLIEVQEYIAKHVISKRADSLRRFIRKMEVDLGKHSAAEEQLIYIKYQLGKVNEVIASTNEILRILKVNNSAARNLVREYAIVQRELEKKSKYLENYVIPLEQQKDDLTPQIANQIRSKKKIKPSKIIWIKSEHQLLLLFKSLGDKAMSEPFINLSTPKALRSLISDHFEIKGAELRKKKKMSLSDQKEITKIDWVRSLSLLNYLFAQLGEKKFLDPSFLTKPHAIVAGHFLGNGKPLTNDQLSNLKSQLKFNSSNKPDHSDVIDSIIEEIMVERR